MRPRPPSPSSSRSSGRGATSTLTAREVGGPRLGPTVPAGEATTKLGLRRRSPVPSSLTKCQCGNGPGLTPTWLAASSDPDQLPPEVLP